ncbi:unnamed protein product [Linum trigynum]|uniref:Uncharacterized protein n=2 Tax=Linum trigynum TaxID=586398 RepID=A0AAV2D548_9ROSI
MLRPLKPDLSTAFRSLMNGAVFPKLSVEREREQTPSATSMEPEEVTSSAARRRLSCTKHFDALWFCYSPVHQMQQYYRLGVLDNCSGKWSALYDCLTLKTKRSSEIEDILNTREKAKTHIWTFRSKEEASAYWTEQYGDMDEVE